MIKLYVDGFPRSGNTYLDAALRLFYPDVEFGQGITHSTSVIFSTLKNDPDAIYIVPLRDPVPTVESGSLMSIYWTKDAEMIPTVTEKITGYSKYHSLFLDRDRVFMAPFDVFTSDINSMLDQLEKYIPDLQGKRVSITDEECLKLVRSNAGFGDNPIDDTIRANLPRDRHPLRDKILEVVSGIDVYENLRVANYTFEVLSTRYYEDRQLL